MSSTFGAGIFGNDDEPEPSPPEERAPDDSEPREAPPRAEAGAPDGEGAPPAPRKKRKKKGKTTRKKRAQKDAADEAPEEADAPPAAGPAPGAVPADTPEETAATEAPPAEPGGKKKRRRRRKKKGGGSEDAAATPAVEDEIPGEDRGPAMLPDHLRRWAARATGGPRTAGQRVAVLLDGAGLVAAARALEGDVAWRRVLRATVGDRPTVRAVCYLTREDAEGFGGQLTASGFEICTLDSTAEAGMALAIDAMALAEHVDTVIVVPGSTRLPQLAGALRGQGVRVETASYEPPSKSELPHTRLGRECLIVP